ncbi:MAG TPA: peptidoglycan DD-metalloendopeptidase family protein [Steroidobacteraceae bacterium]|nr:peptidoglycan DD-metalloendopeptidase family protein [Steroidobacteraceae bacterium]
MRDRCRLGLLALLVAALSWAAAADEQSGKRAVTEAQLKSVQSEIARIRAKVSRDQIETDKMMRELRNADLAVGAARESLDELRREHVQRSDRRAQLATQKRSREAQIAAERAALAGELRAAYLIGREEPLKLLLNQQDPGRAGRMFVYYSYFGRARAAELEHIESDVKQLGVLDTQLQGEEQHLSGLESEQQTRLDQLEQARAQRGAALASLKAQSRTRAQALQRLQRERSGLETLLRELRRAIAKFPIETNDAFSRLKGQLAWPVAGHIEASFGQTRAGAVKWDGMLIDTERGAQVHAVYQGRVIFADWLPGLGLLTIIDHGDGYLSLYAHNERLFKAVGEHVAAGEAIAAAGDSGGSTRPELYFEIRRAGRPVDPRPWFKAAAP